MVFDYKLSHFCLQSGQPKIKFFLFFQGDKYLFLDMDLTSSVHDYYVLNYYLLTTLFEDPLITISVLMTIV
jgi:hypothetical protein